MTTKTKTAIADAMAKAAKPAAEAPEVERATAAERAAKIKFKIPKKPAECADLLYTTRIERLALSKQVEAMEAQESILRQHLIETLPLSEATGVKGKLAGVTIVPKTVVQVKNFEAVVEYMIKNYKKNPGVISLIQRRVNDATVKDMWDQGKEVPGVEPFETKTVSLSKLPG